MSANAEMIEYWNGETGRAWVRGQELLDRLLEPLGARAVQALGLRGGERVLDVGCGCGASSLALARAVGERGAVTGLDISRPMLEHASARAAREGLAARIEWREADAQSAAFEPGRYDAVYSRFGVMFFAEPVAAFAQLARAARSGAQLAFVCWQPRAANAWFTEPARVAAAHLELPAPAADDTPGPYGLASAERARELLHAGGWRSVEFTSLDTPLWVGNSVEEAVQLLTAVGPVGAALRNPDIRADVRARVLESVRAVVQRFADSDSDSGAVRAPAAAWLATAQR